MAGNIKGITIEFNGDTTNLDKALRDISTQTRNIDKELRQVNSALKFNPTSVDLWRQKQTLLSQKVAETKDKLALLKQEQARMDASGVDKNSEEYRKLQREIITTESKLNTFQGQLKQIGNVKLKAVSEQFKEMGSKLTEAGQAMKGISMAAAALATSLGALAYKSGQWADDLNTMSKQYSIGTGDLQKYAAAADLVDVSLDTIAKSHTKLEKQMGSASKGTGDSAEAFKKLGVDIKNADGSLRSSDEVWNDTIKALGKVTNETERDTLAMQLMGKSANELNPLIEDGGKTYENVADTLKKYDLEFVSQKDLDNANKFNDSVDTIKTIGLVTFQNLGTKLAGYLAPALEKVANLIGNVAKWLNTLSPEVLTVIGAIASVLAVVSPLLLVLGKFATSIGAIINLANTLGVSIGALAGPIGIAIAVIAALIAIGVLLYKNWDKIKATAENVKQAVINAFNNLKTAVTNAFNNLKTTATNVWNAIKTAITTQVNNVKTAVSTTFNNVKTTVSNIFTNIKTTATKIWNNIKNAISTAIDNAKKAVSDTVTNIKTKASDTWNAIKTTAQTVWGNIKKAIEDPINNAKTTVSNVVDKIAGFLNFSGVVSKVTGVFNDIKSAITGPIDNAKTKISELVNKVKSAFPFNIGKIFNLKLPHISVSGGKAPYGIGGLGSLPKFSIKWYDKGGIFDSPTVIGVGEKRPEFVGALDDLRKIVREESGAQGVTINVYASENQSVKEIAKEVERRLIAEQQRRRQAW